MVSFMGVSLDFELDPYRQCRAWNQQAWCRLIMRIAVIQSQITPDVAQHGEHIRAMLAQAAAKGAALALFPEGALSGYAKAQVRDWALLDWRMLEVERETIAKCAQALGVIAVVGSAHFLAGRALTTAFTRFLLLFDTTSACSQILRSMAGRRQVLKKGCWSLLTSCSE